MRTARTLYWPESTVQKEQGESSRTEHSAGEFLEKSVWGLPWNADKRHHVLKRVRQPPQTRHENTQSRLGEGSKEGPEANPQAPWASELPFCVWCGENSPKSSYKSFCSYLPST